MELCSYLYLEPCSVISPVIIHLCLQPILSRGSSVPVVGVQFQESTDNRRNFSDMKAFHAVKKQRFEISLYCGNFDPYFKIFTGRELGSICEIYI